MNLQKDRPYNGQPLVDEYLQANIRFLANTYLRGIDQIRHEDKKEVTDLNMFSARKIVDDLEYDEKEPYLIFMANLGLSILKLNIPDTDQARKDTDQEKRAVFQFSYRWWYILNQTKKKPDLSEKLKNLAFELANNSLLENSREGRLKKLQEVGLLLQ